MSAILLPFAAPDEVDWAAFEAHVGRTHDAGLAPAINMDTGYVQLLGSGDLIKALDVANAVTGGDYVAGAYVADEPGAAFDPASYLARCEDIQSRNGTPVIFPSHGLNGHGDEAWLRAYNHLGERLDRFIGFELGAMFVPYGRIVGLDTFAGLLEIASCVGAKHSSLRRQPEWERLALRDRRRPDFMVLTGNDLAIDMVMYGSDYLLGLSTFAPRAFALRDVYWATNDPDFYELNDLLQYLGQFVFRPPVPGYRHNAAQFFKLRGWAASDEVPAGAPKRPSTDSAVLADIVGRLEEWESRPLPQVSP